MISKEELDFLETYIRCGKDVNTPIYFTSVDVLWLIEEIRRLNAELEQLKFDVSGFIC
jgi:hypothetical protein